MLKIMRVSTEGRFEELEAGLPDEVSTTAEAEKIMKNGKLPAGEYVIVNIHGKFKAKEVRQMKIEKLNVGSMARA